MLSAGAAGVEGYIWMMLTETIHRTGAKRQMNPLLAGALVGLAGAATVTAIHQTAKATIPRTAPRMDILGRRAIASGIRAAGAEPPETDRLQIMALVGEVISNSLYYALVAAPIGRSPWNRGTLLGALAGLGAVVLPPKMGLGSAPSRRTPQTKVMAFAWYLLGGLTAAGVAEMLGRRKNSYEARSWM